VAYQWRGNVRELQNCIERAVILTEGDTIHARHLNLAMHDDRFTVPTEDHDPWSKIDLTGSMAEASRRIQADVERRKIVQALKEASGNPGLAAEILQVSFKTLQGKLKDYQIS
jgi:DNA-binding NtrC family response regulator